MLYYAMGEASVAALFKNRSARSVITYVVLSKLSGEKTFYICHTAQALIKVLLQMQKSSTKHSKALVVYLNTCDEDGPFYFCRLVNADAASQVFKKRKARDVLHVPVDDPLTDLEGKYVTFSPDVFRKHNISRIYEVHDWHDKLGSGELEAKQRLENRHSYDPSREHEFLGKVAIITVLPYWEGPSKYLVPMKSQLYKRLLKDRHIFDLSSCGSSSRAKHNRALQEEVRDSMLPYRIEEFQGK